MIKLYINNTLVDTSEDILINLTKEIADIRNPENRNSSWTKTVTIPGTAANNELFGFIFDVNTSIINTSDTTNFLPDFNPNLKANCKIYDDSILQLNGYVTLLQVNVTENLIEYEIAVIGQSGDLFGSVGSGLLTDLDFSEYNHIFNITNIESSWDSYIQINGASGAFQLGRGYVYPLIDYGINPNYAGSYIQDFKPALYAKTIVDKIFSTAGYGYTSDSFFATDFFKHLIIPWTSNFLVSETYQADRYLRTILSTGVHNYAIGDVIEFDTTDGGGSSQYNAGTGVLTIAAGYGGYYNITGGWFINNNNFVPAGGYQFTFALQVNGITQYTAFAYAQQSTGSQQVVPYDLPQILLNDGDVVTWKLVSVTDGATVYTSGQVIDVYGFATIATNQSQAGVGVTIDMSTILPDKTLQKDFLVWLTRMFNLYWDTTDLQNQVRVQDRDTFLTNSVLDFSQKIDISQPINILPMGALDANPYTFTYAQDSDYYNDLYFKQFNKVYGDLEYYIVNDLIRQPKAIEIGFSATPLIRDASLNTDIVVSSVREYDSSGKPAYNGGNIRILYYGGLKATATDFRILDGASAYLYTDYPYAGHLDDPYNSTLDLSFGTPQTLYFGKPDGSTLLYTGNNLFVNYWENFIDEITNKNSKIIRAWFNLNPKDIYNIDFRYQYYFLNQYFRLNRIIDHEVGSVGLTQCEFIKITKSNTSIIGDHWEDINVKWEDINVKWFNL